MDLDKTTFNIDGEFNSFEAEKSYILLFNVDKIPPHLGLVVNRAYFSLKFDEVQIKEAVSPIETYFSKKKKVCVAIELKNTLDLDKTIAEFQKFKELKDGKTTCLNPIKKSLNLDLPSIKFVYQLIPELERTNQINKILSINFPKDKTKFHIFNYSMEMIQERIKNISNA